MANKFVDLKLSNHKRKIDILFYRFLWNMISYVFYFFPGRGLSFARVHLARLFGAQIGKGVLIDSKVEIYCPWNLIIGNYSAIGRGVLIHNFEEVIIGSHCVISQFSYICCSSHRYKKNMELVNKKIKISDYSWVAANCFIHGGSFLDKGTILGAKSCFKGSSKPWSIYEGNPASFVNLRI